MSKVKSLAQAQAELRVLARAKMAEVVAAWRSQGKSDADIERMIRRPLPDELKFQTKR